MSTHETPMVRWYWDQVGGTLIEDFIAVKREGDRGQRLLDAVIMAVLELDRKTKRRAP